MAIAVDQNYDKAQRKISTDNLAQFAGVDCQLLVEKETHRPIIMDGSTIGGKFKCASTDEVKAVETIANNAISQAYADEHYLGITAKAESAKIADNATNATNANTAIKASQDANGNVIPDTYATKTELTSGLATKQPVGDYRTKSELDSIYLGINAKAKSAITADTAKSADSVNWNNVQEKPNINTGVLKTSGRISISAYGDWTAPQDVLCDISTQAGNTSGKYVLALNGVAISSFFKLNASASGPDALVFMPKDSTLSFKYDRFGGMIKGVAYPYIIN